MCTYLLQTDALWDMGLMYRGICEMGRCYLPNEDINHSPKPQRIALSNFNGLENQWSLAQLPCSSKAHLKMWVISFVSLTDALAFVSCCGSKKYTKSPCWLTNSPVKDDPLRNLAFKTTLTPPLRGRDKKTEPTLDVELLVVVSSLLHLLDAGKKFQQGEFTVLL